MREPTTTKGANRHGADAPHGAAPLRPRRHLRARPSAAPDQWPELRFDLPELRYPPRLNCAAELLTGPPDDRPVFRTASGDDWTYGRLRARVDRLAHLLTGDLGVVPGNRVLLRGPTTPGWRPAGWRC